MAKCTGNCATCTLQPNENKQACCSVQILKNIIEVKAMLKEMSQNLSFKDFSALIPIDETEPNTSGAVEENE